MFKRNRPFFLVLLFIAVTLSFARQGQAQNDPPCDSLFVTNLRFDTTPGQLALEALNQSTYGFDYPGFILFDTNMDTLAKEVVNYFGIGGPQTHLLVIQAPINLPQSGYLSLYSGFYDSLHCTWPITLADTLLSVPDPAYSEFELSPNPATNQVRLNWSASDGIPESVRVFNLSGQKVAEFPRIGLNPQFSVEGWKPGLYMVEVRSRDHRLGVKKLLVR